MKVGFCCRYACASSAASSILNFPQYQKSPAICEPPVPPRSFWRTVLVWLWIGDHNRCSGMHNANLRCFSLNLPLIFICCWHIFSYWDTQLHDWCIQKLNLKQTWTFVVINICAMIRSFWGPWSVITECWCAWKPVIALNILFIDMISIIIIRDIEYSPLRNLIWSCYGWSPPPALAVTWWCLGVCCGFSIQLLLQLLVSNLIYFHLYVQTLTQLLFFEYFYIHPRHTSMLNDVVLMKPQGRGFAPR